MKNINRKTFVTEWIKDLRSGRFKQCKAQLCTRDANGNASFCCLGVAAMTGRRLGIKDAYNDVSTKSSRNEFPSEWFTDIMGSRNPIALGINCTSRNDVRCESFNVIADALEEEFIIGQ